MQQVGCDLGCAGVEAPGGVGAVPEDPVLHAGGPRLPPRSIPRIQPGVWWCGFLWLVVYCNCIVMRGWVYNREV